MRFALIASFLMFCCCFLNVDLQAQAQQSGNPAGAEGVDLPTQFDVMLDASNRYQRFKVVPSNWLSAYRANLVDSLNANENQVKALNDRIATLETQIADQLAQVAERDATISQLNEEKDGISLLGNQMSKTLYNTLVWGTIAALVAGLVFFLGRSRYAVSVSRDLEGSNAELSAELEKSKRRRLEVEQDLRRKLQDEKNKNSGEA